MLWLRASAVKARRTNSAKKKYSIRAHMPGLPPGQSPELRNNQSQRKLSSRRECPGRIDGVKVYGLAVVQSFKVQVFKVRLERETSTFREFSKRRNVRDSRIEELEPAIRDERGSEAIE